MIYDFSRKHIPGEFSLCVCRISFFSFCKLINTESVSFNRFLGDFLHATWKFNILCMCSTCWTIIPTVNSRRRSMRIKNAFTLFLLIFYASTFKGELNAITGRKKKRAHNVTWDAHWMCLILSNFIAVEHNEKILLLDFILCHWRGMEIFKKFHFLNYLKFTFLTLKQKVES